MPSIGGDEAFIERMKRQWLSRIPDGGFLQRSKIFLAASRNTVESFGLGIVLLQVGVADGPIPDRAGMRLP